MDEDGATVSVGFAIETGTAFAEVLRFAQMFDDKTVEVIQRVAAIEKATGGMMQMGPATARISTYANAATRDLQSVAKTKAQTEKAGEALIRQLEREASALGRTRDEMRDAKVEAIALAAAQQGNTDMADRLLGAARRRQTAAEAAAEAEAQAAARATAAMQAEQDAIRDAANAYRMFEAVAKQRSAAYQQRQAEEAQAARNAQTLIDKAERLRASIDPATAAQQRFNREMAEARMLVSTGSISLDEYVGKLRMEQAALDASSNALGRHSGTAVANRMAMQGASYQVQDFFTQVSMGANPVNAFAVQGAQLAGQFSSIEGKAGNVARFFMGPWGLAITAGLMLLSPFIAKLWEGNNALDDALAKLKKDAGETDIAAKAKERFKLTQEGVNEAVRAGTEATQKSIEAQRTSAEQANIAAKNNLNEALSLRAKTEARLLDAKAMLEAQIARATGPGGEKSDLAALGIARVQAQLDKVKGDLAASEASVAALQRRVQETRIGLAEEEAKRLSDPMERIKKQYDDQATAARTAARAQIKAGEELSIAKAQQLARELARIETARAAAIKAEQDKARAATRSDGVDRFRSREQAIGIAGRELQGAGMRVDGNVQFGVTSGHANDADHNRYAIDVNVGNGITEANVPNLKARFDELARLYQARGYDVIWNKQFYAAGGSGPTSGAAGHTNHMHIKAPGTIVGKTTQSSTARQQMAELQAIAREATRVEAAQAQTANLYKLADAYDESGGAALVAAARVKAESEAIRQKADVEAAVALDIGLEIAQRVADAAKATASMRDQATAQEALNASVAAGLVPAERAADLVRDRIADLPLLAAIEAAQKVKDLKGVREATAALDEQRAARERLTKAESDARYNVAMQSGKDRLAEMREELRLIGATEEARARAMGEFRARQDAATWTNVDPAKVEAYVKQQGDIAAQGVLNAQAQDAYNASLTETADRWDIIAQKVQFAAQGMSEAFGTVGQAIGDVATIYAGYHADRARAEAEHQAAITKAGSNEKLLAQENARYALRSTGAQIAMYGDMASAAKGFFAEGSKGWKALQAAEQVYRAVQMAMSLRAMVQNALETAGVVTNAAVKATAEGTAGIASQSKLPFPLNIAAMAATAAALIAAGVAVFGGGGGSNTLPKANDGTGTVLGDSSAKSDSIKNAIDALKDIDTLMLSTSRQMANSLRSIENQIGGVASLVVRAGNVNASAGVAEGFKPNFIGSVLGKIPLIGGLLGGLFGSTTSVVGSGLYAGPQSLGSILGGGFDASYYSDVKKTSKFLGIKTGTSYSTRYTGADAGLETQFALVLREFNDAIIAAAGPLGAATGEIEARLRGFVINIGKIDLQGLTGAQIEEKLNAVFGAAADNMANAAFPGFSRFQRVGEGAFETLVRVASTVETVTAALDQLGAGTVALGIDAKMGLAGQFDSLSDLTNAVGGYFEAFYTKEEQAAAKAAQFGRVFDSLGLTMPSTLAAFRALVEAQDLTTAAGQSTYATLLQLAPAFAELQASLAGAKSAADIASERTDLQRQILQLQGDTQALRALDLAKIDPSNRALQQQVWALADAQDAAKNAQSLADAWKSVGNSIMDEVKRIRGATGAEGGGSFASIMGQFNAATNAARAGDQDAAKSLPGLSQALLKAAADAATSRQELDRIRAQTAASLEATYGVISALTRPASTPATNSSAVVDVASLQASPTNAANDDTAAAIEQLSGDVDTMRKELFSALVTIAGNTGKTARVLDTVTQQSGGDALSIVQSA